MSNKFLLFFLMPFLISAVGCDRVKEDTQGDEMARFEAWIEVNNLSGYKTPSGLYYISEREGTGLSPEDSDIVVYSSVVRNLDGFIYGNTYKDTAKLYGIYGLYNTTHYAPEVIMYLSKNTVPQGLSDGIGKMKEGGKARLIMPSSLAFGEYGSKSISPYTSLIYDVELKEVFKGNILEYEKSIIQKYMTDSAGFLPITDTVYRKVKIASTKLTGVAKDSTVKVNYIGRFLDGFIFDTNIKSVAIDSSIYVAKKSYSPWEFVVGVEDASSPLSGFQFAVKQMKEGEKSIFIIPSSYMYGVNGKNSDETTKIPPYTPLVFEITLVEVIGKKKVGSE